LSTVDGRNTAGSALDSVRQIERTLEDRQEIQRIAEKRRAAAHKEAQRMVAAACREGERAAEERRHEVLAAADEKAGRILEAARVAAEELRGRAARDRDAAVSFVVERVLPGGRT
jgi:cell division septum initiation protein DivIVA